MPDTFISLSPDSLPHYTGETCVKKFLTLVEELATLGGWDDSHKISILKLRLKGEAQRALFADKNLQDEKVWDTFKANLIKRFEKITIPGQAQYVFRQCKQRMGESARDYIYRLRKTANETVSYTNNANKNAFITDRLDEDTLHQFLEGLLPDLALRVMTHNPTTFPKACERALSEEINLARINKRKLEEGISSLSLNETQEATIGFSAQPKTQISNQTNNKTQTYESRNPSRDKSRERFQDREEQGRGKEFSTYRSGFQTNQAVPRQRQGNFRQNFRNQEAFRPSRNPATFRKLQKPPSYLTYARPSNSYAPSNPQRPTIYCFQCSLPGHVSSNCNTNCFNCNVRGHIQRDCPRALNTKRVGFRPENSTRN